MPEPEFGIAALLGLLSDPEASAAVVTLSIEETPEVDPGQEVQARYLDLDATLQRRFLRGLRRTLQADSHRDVDPYEHGWVSIDRKVADADAGEAEGPVLDEVRAALRTDPSRDFPVPDDQADGNVDGDQEPEMRAYAVVARDARGRQAIFFRRKDPAERLTRNQFTALLSQSRLTKAERIYIFDSGFDVVMWDGRLLIKNSTAFELLFSNERVRREGARKAVRSLVKRMAVVNEPDLMAVIDADSRFAARLRAIERRGDLARLDPEAIRRSTKRFEIDHRMLSGDALRFLPRWRFIWLAVLEDSLLESPGTNQLYVSRLRNPWRRHEVTCVERDADGNVIALVGDWGRVDAIEAARQLRLASVTYFAQIGDSRAEIDVPEDPSGPTLVAQVGDSDEDRLGDIGGC